MLFASELAQVPSPEGLYDQMLRRGELLDSLGFDIALIGHHRFTPGMPANVFALLAGVAARTERLRLGSGVLVLPSYHPLDVAEALGTLDQVSHGRAFLGVGVGYREYELAPIGRDFSKRGQIMTEALEVLNLVLKGEPASYHGKQFDFDDVRVEPAPVQSPPPILVGAMTPV